LESRRSPSASEKGSSVFAERLPPEGQYPGAVREAEAVRIALTSSGAADGVGATRPVRLEPEPGEPGEPLAVSLEPELKPVQQNRCTEMSVRLEPEPVHKSCARVSNGFRAGALAVFSASGCSRRGPVPAARKRSGRGDAPHLMVNTYNRLNHPGHCRLTTRNHRENLQIAATTDFSPRAIIEYRYTM